MSYWKMATVGYDSLVNAIIRPPRARYSIEDLGPVKFRIGNRDCQRRDFQLINDRGLQLECSHWEPVKDQRPAKELPCVCFLHGNASCRAMAVPMVRALLSSGMTVFALDLSGSGMSEGEYISLGLFEREDLATVISYLRGTGTVSTIGLWGRSMGAATTILYSSRDPSIAGIILDSGFTDLYTLCRELVKKAEATPQANGWKVPGLVVKGAIRLIRNSVKKRAGFDIYDLKPIAECPKAFIPAMFCHGEDDDFILPHHSQKMYDAYSGDKNIVMVSGNHNSPRPQFLIDSATIFLKTALRIPDDYCVSVEERNLHSRNLGFGFGFPNIQFNEVERDVDVAAIRRLLEEDSREEGGVMNDRAAQRQVLTEEEALEKAIQLSLNDIKVTKEKENEKEKKEIPTKTPVKGKIYLSDGGLRDVVQEEDYFSSSDSKSKNKSPK
eukprot:g4938.t1